MVRFEKKRTTILCLLVYRVAMRKRTLGSRGLTVSSLGLGCMGMSEFYGSADEKEGINVIHRALDLGINFLDTADIYGLGRNEELVGRALHGRREGVVLASKFGIVRNYLGQSVGVNGRPTYVRSACEASLKRLRTDVIDLYYQHRVDPETPIEDTVGAMCDLVREGKVKYLGLSEASVATIKRAAKVHPISALQTEFSLWSREPETEIIPALRELGIGFVSYSPLGRGFLSGRFKTPEDLPEGDWRRTNPRFQGKNFEQNLKVVKELEKIAQQKSCTPSQLALAWVLAKGDDIVPIPGTKHVGYLEENMRAIEIRLTNEELNDLDRVFPPNTTAGDRYESMAAVNR